MRSRTSTTMVRSRGCLRWALFLLMLAGCRSALQMPEDVHFPPAADHAPEEAALPVIAFTIQVGAFSTAERAADYAERLASYGLDTYYFIDDDGLCKVRFDRFETKAQARRRAQALRERGLIEDFYVVQPRPTGPQRDERERLQDSLVQTARRFIGTPYRWGGVSVRQGFDCSGLTMTVYRLNGLELPRNSRSQFQVGRPVPQAALEKGDLVFFATGRRDRVSHVGIYSGKGRFIHAPGEGKTIRTASLSSSYFQERYAGARRYIQVN
jgi:hypothetical protein